MQTASVSNFLAIPADTAYKNPQQALTLIAATAANAVQQVRQMPEPSSGSPFECLLNDPLNPALEVSIFVHMEV
jgi:hypothetical protein